MNTDQLELDCRQALQDLRAALIEMYASLGVDPNSPQDTSRRFSLNKNLTWKISKIINADDALSAIQHIPGANGLDILLTTFVAAGASDQSVANVRAALQAFDEFVVRHAGDRPDLDLMLDSMGLSGESGLEASRELAFRGNSGIWGVQSRIRTTMGLMVPSRTEADKLDIVLIGGFAGFRLFRPTVRWPLFRFGSYTDKGAPNLVVQREPIDPNGVVGDLFLLEKFCSPNLPEITPSTTNGSLREYFLPPGAVGNTGAFDCFLGDIARGMPRYKTPEDAHGEFASTVTLPVETLIFDVILHRDIEMTAPPNVFVYGRPEGGPDNVASRSSNLLLPIKERCYELAGKPPAVSIASVPKYAEMMQWVYDKLGYDRKDFRGYRLIVKHPPMNSTIVLRWPLEEKR